MACSASSQPRAGMTWLVQLSPSLSSYITCRSIETCTGWVIQYMAVYISFSSNDNSNDSEDDKWKCNLAATVF